MKTRTLILAAMSAALVHPLLGAVTINPAKAVITIGEDTPYFKGIYAGVARELKLHLDLITGCDIPLVTNGVAKGGYVFRVGALPPGVTDDFAGEEAHWRIGPKEAWFYGSKWHGAQFAVTDFLEDELGVRWPWGTNIAFRAQNPLVVKRTEGSFIPPVAGHNFRKMRWDPAPMWIERMRRGSHDLPSYGHAFTGWGERFAETHPEWFAMRKDGKRLPPGFPADKTLVEAASVKHRSGMPLTDRMSMCLTASGLVEQVVADWRKAGAKDWINCCDNDVYGDQMCQCEKCKALDCGPAPDEPKGRVDYLSDRSVNFAKRVLAEARKVNPKVKGCIYAYNGTEHAPQREKIENGELAVMIVPTRFSMPQIKRLLDQWQAAGFREFGIRPNRHSYYRVTSLPIGNEKHFFDVWQYEHKAGAKWFDYDAAQRNYAIEYFRDYVILKAMQDPSKPFEYWEDHYFSAFGAAKEDVKAYFRYWREKVWEKRIAPVHASLDERGGYFIRPLLDNLGTYYKESDFRAAGAFLDNALKRKGLSAADRARIEELKVCNEGGRLLFRAIVNKDDADRKALYEFRKAHDIPTVMWEENYIHDIAGLKKYLYDHGLEKEVPEYIRKKDRK